MSIGSNVYLTFFSSFFFFLYVFIIPHHLLHGTIGCVLLRWMDFVFAFRCFTGGYDYFCFKLPYTLTNTMYRYIVKDTESREKKKHNTTNPHRSRFVFVQNNEQNKYVFHIIQCFYTFS